MLFQVKTCPHFCIFHASGLSKVCEKFGEDGFEDKTVQLGSIKKYLCSSTRRVNKLPKFHQLQNEDLLIELKFSHSRDKGVQGNDILTVSAIAVEALFVV